MFCYRDVLKVILLSLIAFPCIPMVKFLASDSDRNDPIKIAASATIHGSVFFCGNACDWSARTCVAGLQLRAIHFILIWAREAWSSIVVCNVCFLRASFADFWEVFDVVACYYTC